MQNDPNKRYTPKTLEEKDWATLLERIKVQKCTPFLGAGVNSGLLPLGFQVAQRWADKYKYPFKDSSDLARVAQYLALTLRSDLWAPKELIQKSFSKRIKDLFDGPNVPDFTAPNHPLGVLAALPLPIYVTTNYDDFMFRSLRVNGKRPKAEFCEWNREVKDQAGLIYDDADTKVVGFQKSYLASSPPLEPKKKSPLVYHLHGHYKLLESIVLTENDYMDFLVRMSTDPNMLHPKIKLALTGTSLLFMGYSLADTDFRVLYRGLIHPLANNRRISVAIQLRPSDLPETDEQRALEYLQRYFEDFNIRVYWGTAEEFAAELWKRWNDLPEEDEDGDEY